MQKNAIIADGGCL